MVMQMLDLSTAHITQETAKWIEEELKLEHSTIIAFPKDEYGWFIHVPNYEEDAEYMEYPPKDLLYLFGVAKGMHCEWICLDRDAQIDWTLPHYKW